MAYRIELHRPVAENVRRIAIEQIDRATARCDDPRNPDELVHDLRKRCKKLRGLVRLVRADLAADGTYAAENGAFRDGADGLGGMRDREAAIVAYDALLDRFADEVARSDFAPIRRALTARRRAACDEAERAARVAAFRQRMIEARARVPGWPLGEDGFAAVRDGLVRTYRRGRKAMKAVADDPSAANHHEWRKRAKYHWYHLRLIEPAAPEAIRARRRKAKKLGDLLGAHHDLAVLRAMVECAAPPAANDRNVALVALIDRRAAELAAKAGKLGRKLYRTKPARFEAEMARLWPAREN